MEAALPRVVIIGAGFGGLACARRLANQPVAVALVDQNNFHLFTPLLYQVASSLLNPSDIAQPVRTILRGVKNVRFVQACVTGVDFAGCVVHTEDGTELPYDYLVIAAGSTTNYFGQKAVEARAEGLKDLPEALGLRNHILRCLEEAASAAGRGADPRPWLTFVVVGAGPTGVEYAGALSELVRGVLPREYPELDKNGVRLVLAEGLERLLPAFPEGLGASAARELVERGVEVRTGRRVVDVTPETVTFSDGDVLPARTLVWAAGVRPSDLVGAIEVGRSRSGRIEIDSALRVKGHSKVFAIGDVAAAEHEGREIPMLSSPAMQEGRAAADNILRAIAGRPLRLFRYRSRGSMATIGKGAAVAKIGPLKVSGFVGWVLWLAVHLYFLIGFRNRFAVLVGWAWNYMRSDRPVRMLVRAREPLDSDKR